MHAPSEKSEPGCPGCSRCPDRERPADDDPTGSSPAGWRLGMLCLGVFVMPVLLGIVGAVCWADSDETRFFGAIVGLVVGVAVAMAVGGLLCREGNGNTA